MLEIPRKIARFIFGRLIPRRNYPVIRGPLKGMSFLLGSLAGEGAGASVYFNAVEPEQTTAIALALKPGDVFFDIGANVGYYTLLASKLVGADGSVVALEPLPRNLEYLEHHVKLNRLTNVEVMPLACAAANGTARFKHGANPAMGRIVSEGTEIETETFEVGTLTLSEISKRTGLLPHVIKIDVEGAELDVLHGGLGLIDEFNPDIFLSTHSPERRKECLALLEDHGYRATPLANEEDPFEFVLTPKGRSA